MKKSYKLITILGALSLLLTGCNTVTRSSAQSSSDASSSSEPKPVTYTITWKNYDGKVLEVDENVAKDALPTYDGTDPMRQGNEQYTYNWTGWTPKVVNATADATYTATFDEVINKYTVTWKNYDGATLKTEQVFYGTTPEYTGDAPTKDSTVEHTYTFENWSPAIATVTGNVTYTASFKEETRKYNVTWKNPDGSVLKTTEVEYGALPSFGDEAPTQESTAQYSYVFDKWTPNITSVTGDATYTAAYNSEVRKYTITWLDYDGTILEVDENVPYGTIPSYNSDVAPSRPDTRGVSYVFAGWEPAVTYVSEDKTYSPKFTEKGYFVFDPIEYEMQSGYKLSDINGAPWINSNIWGEIYKIKKPSLKDDFYTSVNYETIWHSGNGAFDDCADYVDAAFEALCKGEELDLTTNGLAFKTVYNNIPNSSEATAISQYLNGLDPQTYLSSKDCFASKNALISFKPTETGYEVGINDGYMNGNYDSLSYLFLFDDTRSIAKQMTSKLSSGFSLGFSTSDLSTICNFDENIVDTAYNAYYSYGDSYRNYEVNNIPWAPLKSALLDLGLAANTSIRYKRYFEGCFNSIYNNYYSNNTETLKKVIITRLAFDCRSFMGISAYKEFNRILSQLGYFARAYFRDEYNIYYEDNTTIAKRLARVAMPIITEQSYIELEGSEEVKAEVSSLIDDILAGYKELAQDSWLDNNTKTRMIRKLDYMKYASCYSDAYKNFPSIVDDNTTSKTGFEIYGSYASAVVSEAVNKRTDTTGFFSEFHSYTINAYYSPSENIFVILNAIVKGMLGSCVEEKYGMIGAVIGHEITHAFDSTGANYDENGNANNWWSNSDKNKFNTKVNNMIKFYDQITLKKGLKVSGNTVNTEATADMGGVKVMLLLAKKIENFDYDKFFKAYAYVWCSKPMSINDVEETAKDEHPFDYLRANVTMAQFDEFVETYDIGPGDGMYIPEEQRVKIW